MHIRYWGDSYDIVKQSMLRWLSAFGQWWVHPMFTEQVETGKAADFAAFLGARLVTDAVLTTKSDRLQYLAACRDSGHLFLDPDTGVRLQPLGGKRASEFLFASELVSLACCRPTNLSMVFDQSHPRGGTRASLELKLEHLAASGVAAFAYESHACFIIAGADRTLVSEARAKILSDSRLPPHRLVSRGLN